MNRGICKLLGTYLTRGADGQKFLVKEIPPGTIIGLYFLSEKSEKVKEFSEHLIKFHEKKKKSDQEFEVVLIPLDEPKNRLLFVNSWTRKSQFLIFQGDDVIKKEEYLIRKYSVQESPTLILIDGNSGCVINFEGRQKILEDPTGKHFPWGHRTLSQFLEMGNLMVSTNTSSPCTNANASSPTSTTTCSSTSPALIRYSSEHKEYIKAFYFAAFWCPPCRNFLSTLIDVYHRVNKEKKTFEIIFVSSDRSKASFDRFFCSMPWLAIPYEDEDRRQGLTTALNIKSIPTLVLTDPQDNIITTEGRLEINEDLEALDFPWYPKSVEELRDKHSSILNVSLCLIYFLAKDDDSEYEQAEGTLRPIANEIAESDVEEAFQPKFFIATDSELSESLQLFIDLDESSSHLVILDIPNFRYAVLDDAQIREETSVREFLHKFQTDQLQYHYIQSRFV